MDEVVITNPKEARTLLLDIIKATNSDDLLGNIGAGYLEDFFEHHANQFIGQAQIESTINEKFRKALLMVRLTPECDGFESFSGMLELVEASTS